MNKVPGSAVARKMPFAGMSGGSMNVHHKTPFRSSVSAEHATVWKPDHPVADLPPKSEQNVRMAADCQARFRVGQPRAVFLMCDTRDLGVHTGPGGRVMVSPQYSYMTLSAGIGFSQRLFEDP